MAPKKESILGGHSELAQDQKTWDGELTIFSSPMLSFPG